MRSWPPRAGSCARGLLGVVSTLAVITLFNPHVYLDTVLLMGSIGARQEGALKWVYVIGAASASLSWFVLLAFAGRRLGRLFEAACLADSRWPDGRDDAGVGLVGGRQRLGAGRGLSRPGPARGGRLSPPPAPAPVPRCPRPR